MDPTHIDHHAFYHSPMINLVCINITGTLNHIVRRIYSYIIKQLLSAVTPLGLLGRRQLSDVNTVVFAVIP